jgi:hypothetical protein
MPSFLSLIVSFFDHHQPMKLRLEWIKHFHFIGESLVGPGPKRKYHDPGTKAPVYVLFCVIMQDTKYFMGDLPVDRSFEPIQKTMRS